MSNTIKFTQEELTLISDLQKRYNRIAFELGQLRIEQVRIERLTTQLSVDADKQFELLESLRKEEVELAKKLQEKYGEGQLNLETGEFTPRPKV